MASGRFLSGGNQDGQALNRKVGIAAAQPIQPNQPERQYAVDIQRLFGGSDGRKGSVPFTKQRPGVTGGQAVVQVSFGAQFGDAPTGKLTQQGTPKALPVFEPGAAAGNIAAGRMGQVNQLKPPGASAESFDFQFQARAVLRMNRTDAPHQVAGFAPDFQGHGFPATLQLEIIGSDEDGVVAGIEYGGLAAGREESLYGEIRAGRISYFFRRCRPHTNKVRAAGRNIRIFLAGEAFTGRLTGFRRRSRFSAGGGISDLGKSA